MRGGADESSGRCSGLGHKPRRRFQRVLQRHLRAKAGFRHFFWAALAAVAGAGALLSAVGAHNNLGFAIPFGLVNKIVQARAISKRWAFCVGLLVGRPTAGTLRHDLDIFSGIAHTHCSSFIQPYFPPVPNFAYRGRLGESLI